MQNPGRLDDVLFEHPERVGIGHHERGHILVDELRQGGDVQHTGGAGRDARHCVSGDGGRGRVGAVGGIGDENLLAGIAALLEQGANQQNAGELAVRAGGGLQGDGIHAGDLGEGGFEAGHHFHAALRQGFRLVGVRPGEALQPRHQLIDARVVLHGAGAQRVHAVVDGVVPGGEAGEVANSLHFADFGEIGDLGADVIDA